MTSNPGFSGRGQAALRSTSLAVTTLVTMTDSMRSLAEVKARLSAFVESVQRTHERVIITKNGRPAAVLTSIEDHEALVETLDVLSDPDTLAAIREAERPDSPTYSTNEVLDELLKLGRISQEQHDRWLAG